jgi:hypothetical protein
MTRSRIIDRQFSSRGIRTSRKPCRQRLYGVRPSLERLDVRNLLSIAGGSSETLWLAQFSGMPGDTRASQIADAQQLLKGEQNVQVVDSVGVPGLVILQTPLGTDLPSLETELAQVPGFRYVEIYDPSADPSSRISQFPLGPALDDGGDAGLSTLAPPVSTSTAPTNTSSAEVTNLNGFDGMNSQVNPFTISPPDTIGAAGPNSYIETVNTAVQIYNKDGTALTPGTEFSSFFSSLGDTQDFTDPVVVYNDITQRFFIGTLDYNASFGITRYDVAISTSPNPTTLTSSDWNFYRYNADDMPSGFSADYPKIGYNAEGYVVTFNEFANGSYFDHSAVLAIRNDGGTDTGNQAVTVPGGFSNFTLAPARMHDLPSNPDQPMWFVETAGAGNNSGGDQIIVVRMDNPFASPSWTFTNLNVSPYLPEPNPLGGNTGLWTRMYFSALRTVDGVTHLVAANSPGQLDASGNVHAKVRWYDIDVTDPASPSLYQEGEIDPGPGIDTYFPDADIAPDGAIGMTYSQSLPFNSSDPRAGVMDMYVTGRLPTDPPGTMQPGVVAKLGPDGSTVLAAGAGGANNLDSLIENYQVSTSGTYYAVVSGVGGSREYQLVVTRNADFDTKNNAAAAQAQDISGTAGVLGYLDASQGPAAEWFAVQLTAGQSYSFPTSTPNIGGPGLYTNELIPQIDLYDASGSTLLASGTTLADGRNQTITFTPATSGTYLIRLTSQGGTSGEFFLDPAGAPLTDTSSEGGEMPPLVAPKTTVISGAGAVDLPPFTQLTEAAILPFDSAVLLSSLPPETTGNIAASALVAGASDLCFKDDQWLADRGCP